MEKFWPFESRIHPPESYPATLGGKMRVNGFDSEPRDCFNRTLRGLKSAVRHTFRVGRGLIFGDNATVTWRSAKTLKNETIQCFLVLDGVHHAFSTER